MKQYDLFINNQFVPAQSGETFESINPATGEIVGLFARGDKADIDLAVSAAKAAFETGPWPLLTGKERAALMNRLADLISKNTQKWMPEEIADSGSTYKKAQGEFWISVRDLKYFAKLAETDWTETSEASRKGFSRNIIEYEPIGVCGQIIPWNFPLSMAIWKLGPALAAGCTVVLKPAEQTPLTASKLGALIIEAGFPPGVINIVTGYGAEAGDALVRHPDIAKIAFTGSTEIGKLIMARAAATMKRVTLECGGKSANILLEDADWDIALDGALYAIFYHSGQCCTAGSRLLVPLSCYEMVLGRLLEKAKTIQVGDPQQDKAILGPVISQKQLDRIINYIDSAIAQGARLITGGHRATGQAVENGFFVEPTIFADVTPEMTIAREEIFGPVLAVIAYDDEAEAIRIANDSDYGLAAAVWSKDEARALRVARQLKTGTVWINEYHMISEKAPFGGFKQSGLGRELGPNSVKAYMEPRHIHIDELKTREKKFWFDAVIAQTGMLNKLTGSWHQLQFLLKTGDLAAFRQFLP